MVKEWEQVLLLETQNTLTLRKLQDLENKLNEAEFSKYKFKKNCVRLMSNKIKS
jgi:hypothetical protein